MFPNYYAVVVHLAGVMAVAVASKCPESSGSLRRLGNTRFYIEHGDKREGFVTQTEARQQCESHGLKLAKIRNMLTMAMVSRELEKLAYQNLLKDTWYWLDAVFDPESKKYFWGNVSSKEPVTYSNFLYRPPRPTGIGAHITYNSELKKDSDIPQCLTLALPWPWPEESLKKSGFIYGMHATFDERYCESKKKRHAMCESPDSSCGTPKDSPFAISEKKVSYFEDGNWMFGNRTYFVNWKQRTYEETEKYCQSLGLQVMSPGLNEKYLIPFLKLWARGITAAQFWTNLKFNPRTQTIVTKEGDVVAKLGVASADYMRKQNGRSLDSESEYCVALSYAYEFKDQMPCDSSIKSDCSWSFMHYVPANCNNYHGAICQHQNWSGIVTWPKMKMNDLSPVLNENALTDDFGYAGNSRIIRSKYKQTFGNLYCPFGYQMASVKTKNWEEKPAKTMNMIYEYDYHESYWLLDAEGLNKNENSKCTLSWVDPKTGKGRKMKKVSCTEWHFYLCEKTGNGNEEEVIVEPKGKTLKSKAKPPTMEWKDGAQPRKYPDNVASSGYNTLGL